MTPLGSILPPLQDVFRGVPSDLRTTLVNLALVLVLARVLAWHYLRYAPVLSNKRKFARAFVFIAATTMLVITVVKTSLALSLGLVGALSIIRFRTPIKEPEELAYLFLAIGVGLGLGAADPTTAWTLADLRLVTAVVFLGILAYMTLLGRGGSGVLPPRVVLTCSGEVAEGSGKDTIARLLAALGPHAPRIDLRRVDAEGTRFEATFVLDLEDPDGAGEVIDRAREVLPGGSVSLVDGSALE